MYDMHHAITNEIMRTDNENVRELYVYRAGLRCVFFLPVIKISHHLYFELRNGLLVRIHACLGVWLECISG